MSEPVVCVRPSDHELRTERPLAGVRDGRAGAVSFSLRAVDADGGEREEFLSLSNRAMADLRAVLVSVPCGDPDGTLHKLSFNNGDRVTARECRWIDDRLWAVDRGAIRRDEPGPEELLDVIDELSAFADRCAMFGGFNVE
jgi:hypothetical protein